MKTAQRALFLLFFLISSHCVAHWDEAQVTRYVHHSELQRRSTWQLLSLMTFWGDEKILDIGCGDGRNTAWMALLSRAGQVRGIDPNPVMVNWAQKQYHALEFPNLSFEIGNFLTKPTEEEEGFFDLVTSFFSLHCAVDKAKAIQIVYDYLRPRGFFLAVAPPPLSANPHYAHALKQTMNSSKWSNYFENFQTIFQFATAEEYGELLQQTGFSLLKCTYVPSIDPFINKREYIDWFKGTMPQVHFIPEDLQDEFVSDVVDHYLDLSPEAIDDQGTIHFYFGRIEIWAEKPALPSPSALL